MNPLIPSFQSIKNWGTSERLQTELHGLTCVETHIATAKPFSECSIHFHSYRYNLFVLCFGQLWVHNIDNNESIFMTQPGQHCLIAPGTVHQFVSGQDGATFVEMYWVDLTAHGSTDITRQNHQPR